MLALCLQMCHDVYTGYQEPLNKGDKMPEMDTFHATVLEGYWWGLNAHEIAEQLGDDPMLIANIMDTFRDLGY
jgi:hypothetical protein